MLGAGAIESAQRAMEKGPSDTSGLPGSGDTSPTGLPGLPWETQASTGTGLEEPPRHDRRAWIELIVAIALAIVLTLLLIGFVSQALTRHPGSSRSGYLVSAAVAAALLVLCAEWAVHAEHRIRRARRQPVALSLDAGTPVRVSAAPAAAAGAAPPVATPSPAPARPRSPAVRRTGRRKRRDSPGALIFVIVLFGGLGVGFTVGFFVEMANANRSNYVQHHGVLVSGTVTNVDNMESCGRYSCSYTADIAVQLAEPFHGTTTTTVHYPDYSALNDGDQLQLLIDPQQPSYAEIPGDANTTAGSWIVFGVMAVLFVALAVWSGVRLRHLLRLRRSQRAASAPAPA